MCGALTAIGRIHHLADGGMAFISFDIEVSCDTGGSEFCPLNKQLLTNSGRDVTLQAASEVVGSTTLAR